MDALPYLILPPQQLTLLFKFLELVFSLVQFYEASGDLSILQTLRLGDDMICLVLGES